MKEKPWFVYIIECADGKLYTGISNDVDNRIAAHNRGKGCKFTRCRYPVRLAYKKKCDTKSAALKNEMRIQNFKRARKLKLIDGKTGR